MFTYDVTSGNWTVVGKVISLDEIFSGISPSISLASDGKAFVKSGKVRLYRNGQKVQTSDASQSTDDLIPINLTAHLDSSPEMIAISLLCDDVLYGNPFVGKYTIAGGDGSGIVYVPNEATCKFTIYDDDGDGICCSKGLGSYEIFLGDQDDTNLIARGAGLSFGSFESFTFSVTPPTDSVILTVQMRLVEIYNGIPHLSTSLLCNDVLQSELPYGGLEKESNYSDFTRASLFRIANGTQCQIEISMKENSEFCSECLVWYEIFYENSVDTLRTVLVNQSFVPWLKYPESYVAFDVINGQVTRVPISVVIKPDSYWNDISFSMNCTSKEVPSNSFFSGRTLLGCQWCSGRLRIPINISCRA